MRGVAALLVAFFHLRYGVIGVPLFDLYIFKFRFGNRGYLWVDSFLSFVFYSGLSLWKRVQQTGSAQLQTLPLAKNRSHRRTTDHDT